MLNPYEFGSMSNLEFLNTDNPDAARPTWPHFDWTVPGTTAVPERSWRVWEPGRMALSELGLLESDPDNPFASEQRVQGASIHGIKGDLFIKPVAAIFYDADTGVQLAPQPTYNEVFNFYNVFANNGGIASPSIEWAVPPNTPVPMEWDPGYWSTAPVFITMYHGSFNVVDDGPDEGGTIDSGPFDDPDTLLSLDITNPTVLESNRMTWWAAEHVTMPHVSPQYSGAEVSDPDETFAAAVLSLSRWNQPVKKLPLSLSHNFRVGKAQVLWIHVSFGLVGTPLVVDVGGSMHRVAYRPKALYEVLGSMIASPWAVK